MWTGFSGLGLGSVADYETSYLHGA